MELKNTLAINQASEELAVVDTTSYGGSNRVASDAHTTNFFLSDGDDNVYEYSVDGTTSPSSDFIPKNALSRVLTPANFGLTSDYFADGIYRLKYRVWFVITGTASINTSSGTSVITGVGTTFTSNLIGFGDTTLIKIVSGSDEEINAIDKTATFNGTSLQLETESAIANGAVTVYAGFEYVTAVAAIKDLRTCLDGKASNIKVIEDKSCLSCDKDDVTDLLETYFGIYTVYAQLDNNLPEIAHSNIIMLNKVCKSSGCSC